MLHDDYLTSSDALLSRAEVSRDADTASAGYRLEAQVKAIKAVAAAIDRVA